MSEKSIEVVAFGKVLARLLDQQQLNQTAFAKLAKTTQSNVSAICNGRRQCGIGLATRFANVLNLQGKDRIAFLSEAKQPKWKGFDHSLYGPEAVLHDVMMKALKAKGFGVKDIRAVVALPDPAKAIIVNNNGKTFHFNIDISLAIG